MACRVRWALPAAGTAQAGGGSTKHRDHYYASPGVADVECWQPSWLAFTGKGTAAYAARALGHRKPGLGAQDWEVAGAQVFVLPGTSGANQRKDYDGRPDRLSWWRELAEITRPDFPG